MDNLGEIKNQRLFEELGLVNTMGGSLTQNRLKGNVKIHKIFPEIWRNNTDNNQCTEINYYNRGGYNIKSEFYKDKICVSTSKFKYKKGLLISEKTTGVNQKILSYCEFTYYENQKIKSSKVTRLKEDIETCYDIEEEFFFFNLKNNIIKREQKNYTLDVSTNEIDNKYETYSKIEYDKRDRVIKNSSFYLPNNECYYINENKYNDQNQKVEDKTYYDYPDNKNIYSSKYKYNKKGKLISHKRFKGDKIVCLSSKEITEENDIKTISKLGSDLEGVFEDEEGRTLWSDKKEYDRIGNLIKKIVYKNSKTMYDQKFSFEYY
ncbi:MAG: hypothetical protein HOH98_01915 [Flavobacteriaceae bacterium]|jgi:hypothetical protein|nr:hypothetical protein [Flavobacteriaceae bacterium]MBT6448175.1 hypothetical protein [Flavobacteriaceae bacterium]